MKRTCLILICSLSALSARCERAVSLPPDRFKTIATQNVFRLKSPKPFRVEEPPEPNRCKVSLQGIATILGRAQALLAIQPQSKLWGQGPTPCVLAQGDSRFEVLVLEINPETGTVRLNNGGWEELLALQR